MDISGKLQELGWYLTEAGLKKILTLINNDKTVRRVIDMAMDMDLREIGGGALPSGKREDKIKGNIVLQVLKVRNIAAPKANETSKVAPRMLLLELTDGQSSIPAVEIHNIPMLSLALPPGRKIYLKGECLKCVAGYLMLHSVDMTILGGRVQNLEEKWEIARTISEFTRSGVRICSDAGPPSWVPFGKKTQANKLLDAKNFKSLQATANNNPKKGENESFHNFRSEAIAEATKQGGKKVFSGGGQQIVDHNMKKIMDKGYSEDEAKRALAQTNNNLERAFSYLKRAAAASATTTSLSSTTSVSNSISSNRYNNRNNNNNNDDSSTKVEISKPSGNVTLSEFLADKLPTRMLENCEKSETKETVKERIPNPFKSYAALEKNHNISNSGSSNNSNAYDNRPPKQTQINTNQQKPMSSNSNNSYNNRIQERNQSRSKTKFENNMSSSFAANQRRSSSNGNGNGSGSGSYQNRQRSAYNTPQNNNNNNNNRETSINKQHNSRYEQQNSYNGRGSGEKPLRTNMRTNNNNNGNNHSNIQQQRGRRGNTYSNSGGANSYEKINSVEIENSAYHNRRDRERNNVTSRNNERQPQQHQHQKTYKDNPNRPHIENNHNKPKVITNHNNNNNNQHQNQHQNRRNEHRRIHNNNNNNGTKLETNSENNNSSNLVGMVFNSKSAKNAQQEQQGWTADKIKSKNVKLASTRLLEGLDPGNQPYDASKIIGFQSRETNERAMNLLKSQGVNLKTLPTKENQQKQQEINASPISPQNTSPPTPLQNNKEGQKFISEGFKNNSPQINYHHNKTATSAAAASADEKPTVFTPPNVTDSYGMVSNEAWTWKIRDLCLAKYWDDGCYYEAEITAISERTFVVYFVGYGNHEEVLKSDCLPITDANHKAINFAQNAEYSSKHENQYTGYDNRGGNYDGHQRHRSERQVYVPPPKRSEN